MLRSIVLLGLIVILSVHASVAWAFSGADAFATMTSIDTNDLPPQADPEMRRFLKNIAMKLKKDWHGEEDLHPPVVLANFAGNANKTWHVKPLNGLDKNAVAASVLLEKALTGNIPPRQQQVSILFAFDTWPVFSADRKTQSDSLSNQDVDFGPYMAMLQRKVRSNWILVNPPQMNLKAIVDFTINKTGSVKNVHLTTPSKSETYNKAALNAINSSAPFLSFPKGGPGSIVVNYSFQNQAHSKLKTNSGNRFTIYLSQPDVVISRP